MLFLMTNRKDLIRTGKSRAIYRFETNVDNMKIFIPLNYEQIELSDLNCVIQCVITPADPTIEKIGMYKYCEYGDLTHNMLTIEVPITSTITKNIGTVQVWLMFLKENEEDPTMADYVLKTGYAQFNIEDNGSYDSLSETNFDEIWEHSGLDKIQQEVDALSDNKADAIDISGGTVLLKSGDKILGSINLPDDVTWKEWS